MDVLLAFAQLKRIGAWSFFLWGLVCFATAAQAAGNDIPVPQPLVSTIAGSGVLGVRNAPALSASFIEPGGVALGADGTIYIADAGAQQIRCMRNGVVEWFAGRSSQGTNPQQREGGDADGPVQTASFNRPVSIAVSKDGTVYVADLANFRIRKIRNGIVSTFAGSHAQGTADGISGAARFMFPKSVAVDEDGNVYVADYGVGIRKVTAAGAVTTIASNAKVYAVAVSGGGKNLTWAYTAADGIHFNGPHIQDVYAPERVREPDHEGFVVGDAYGITISSPDSVVITDLMHSAVRYVRFEGFPMTRALAGGVNEAIAPVGGYRDGPSEVARVDVPLGVARMADGSILVADAGNRRIRKITGLDARSAITNLSDLGSQMGTEQNYRIVLIGNSFVFHNVLWPESIPGQIESGLIRDSVKLGLHRRPRVTCIRINGLDLFAKKDLISNYLSDGEADIVILIENSIEHGYDMEARPELKAGDKWKVVEPEQLRTIENGVEKGGTQFLMVYVPDGSSLSQMEEAQYRLGVDGLLAPHYGTLPWRAGDKEIESAFLSSGVRALSLLDPMIRAEEMPNRVPFFNTRDEHPSPQGATWIGRAILQRLEQWKPWAEQHAAGAR